MSWRRLRPAGVAPDQLRILEVLQGSDGRSMGELASLALIEPAILIVMGSVVVVILIALYLPIFSLGQASTMGGH